MRAKNHGVRLSRWLTAVGVLAAVAAQGCGDNRPYDLVDVSGLVTLDGEPLADATVMFAPKGGGGKQLVGPGSVAATDASGRYRLRTFKDERGAVVGWHTVKISTFKQEFVDFKKSDEVRLVSEERVPKRYNRRTTLTFEVTTDGTDEANFALTTDEP